MTARSSSGRPSKPRAAPRRTGRGARLVEVAEHDPVAERMARLGQARADWSAAVDQAWADCRQAQAAAWDAYRQRYDGANAEYQTRVEQIRAEP